MSLRQPRFRIALGAAALALLLTACATGPRPTLVDQLNAADAVAQQVLDRLERGSSATFTADYEITPSLTGQPNHATAIQEGAQPRAAGEEEVAQQRWWMWMLDYFPDGRRSRTCAVGGTDCVDSIDDARIS